MRVIFGFGVLAVILCGARFAAAAPATCGNSFFPDAGEVCENTPALNLNGKTCASYGYSGGSLGCAPDCQFRTNGSGFCTQPSSCRRLTAEDNDFDAGSLIIDMSRDKCGSVHPLGLAWYLLANGVRIAFILDTTKAAMNDPDISVSAREYCWGAGSSQGGTSCTSPGQYASFEDTSAAETFTRGPLVIPEGDADTALHLLHEGVLPQDTSVKFGWGFQVSPMSSACGAPAYCPDFRPGANSGVRIYRAEAAFTAKMLRVIASPPPKVALFSPTGSWLSDIFGLANLGFTRAGATVPSSGLIYDVLPDEAAVAANLNSTSRKYGMIWIGGDQGGPISVTATSRGPIATFVGSGGSLLAAGSATLQLDSDASTRYLSYSPLTVVNGNSNADPPTDPSNPYTQVGLGQAFKTLGGETQGFALGEALRPCVSAGIVKNSPENTIWSFLLRDDTAVGGVVGYIGGSGSNYGNNCASDNMATWQRTFLNILFGMPAELYTGDLARSSPIVVDGTSPALTSFQGSMHMPPAMSRVFFTASAPQRWTFPSTRGNLRAYDMSGTPALTKLDDSTGLTIMWDGAQNIPSTAAARNIYTADAYPSPPTNFGLTRIKFDTGNAAALAAAGLTGGAPLIDRLLVPQCNDGVSNDSDGAIDLADPQCANANDNDESTAGFQSQLGGIDQSTPAFIAASESVGFATPRSPVLYAAGLDGMLHAFSVPDVSTGSSATWSWASATELWAYVPQDQLPLLKNNDQRIQASLTVADIFGAVIDSTDGKSSARNINNDTTREWVTILALASYNKTGRGSLTMLDVTNPEVGGSCPNGWATCEHGPNPLWSRSSAGASALAMGRATGSALGVVLQAPAPPAVPTKQYRAAIFVTTDIPGGAGVRLFGFDAITGAELWPTTGALTFNYGRVKPGIGLKPNEPPGHPVLIDRTGGLNGYQTDLYFGDFEGKIWNVSELEKDPPRVICVWDATLAGPCNSGTISPVLPANTATVTESNSGNATHPVAAPVTIFYVESSNKMTLAFGTGGAYWAPLASSQYVATLDISDAPLTLPSAATNSAVFDGVSLIDGAAVPPSRIYAAPVVVNRDLYVIASTGITDVIADWRSEATGSIIRFQMGTSGTSWTATMIRNNVAGLTSASALGVNTANDKLVVTAMDKTGVETNNLTANGGTSGAGNTSPNKRGSGQAPAVRVQVWSPALW